MNGYDNTRQNNSSVQQGAYDNTMSPNLPPDRNFSTPVQQTFNTEEMRGSTQQILAQNIGEYVVIEFLIGTEMIMRKQGILYFVGTSYVTLYDDKNNNFIVCDIFSVKFIYFYYPGQRPARNYNVLPNSNTVR